MDEAKKRSKRPSPAPRKRVPGTPSPRKGASSCRFIPMRTPHFRDEYHASTIDSEAESSPSQRTYEALLKNELLGTDYSFVPQDPSIASTSQPSPRSMFQFGPKRTATVSQGNSEFSPSPIGSASRLLLSRPRRAVRKISKNPVKTLEAPRIEDDFYLHLVDWSSTNLLAVGLRQDVYIWNALTSSVTRLCDVGSSDMVTSVGWIERGSTLAVGTVSGQVELWDAEREQRIRAMHNHSGRVGTVAWNANVLSTGGRDRHIYSCDVRTPTRYDYTYMGHRQEVCGLAWSPDGESLASGGNDNHLLVWDVRVDTPRHSFLEHDAAVKAIAWSPHQRGLLVSGGGTADRSIRFWNTLTGSPLCKIDTGSQVCNLIWSSNVNEIVSTHGYSQNQIVVWSYPSMSQLAMLTGHTMRVLYMSISPDGTTIVTGAGDETLRFWNVFPPKTSSASSGVSKSSLSALEIR